MKKNLEWDGPPPPSRNYPDFFFYEQFPYFCFSGQNYIVIGLVKFSWVKVSWLRQSSVWPSWFLIGWIRLWISWVESNWVSVGWGELRRFELMLGELSLVKLNWAVLSKVEMSWIFVMSEVDLGWDAKLKTCIESCSKGGMRAGVCEILNFYDCLSGA